MKEPLFGKTLVQLREIVKELNLPKFTANQITDWLYKKDITTIDEMTNLSKKVRELLIEKFDFGLASHKSFQVSADGTKKYLFPTQAGMFIEAAYIPEKSRNTLCVSAQVGCRMGCRFCMTGKQGFQGNLTAGEILNQIRSLPERDKLTNIVYMGMGEPFDNLQNVLQSFEILISDWGFAISPRRITVSTIGIIPAIIKFLEESECHLAISLHSPFVEERRILMPVESSNPLEKVLETIKKYDIGKQRRVSFEYIMFKGLNDTSRHVKQLARILNGIRCRINLIRFHPIPDSPYKSPDDLTIEKFMSGLNKKGIRTTLRASRGQDISAACGLLSTKGFE
ncbi:MAG: 23S rRNA (adenine(2503)-C(2))-methyltransferase RlmN [Bacteroidetes bacterium]|nr:23S rRNA (adenine(2503)-C(2))-methyltransferase RlmN [Bacteroidota bacterium]MBL7105275.1 23S rRNA (adenine(2503)-C(2))-methyltransferase RlmN [Bacteroidales bacterium]